jgi:hypothetical protein
VFDELQRWWQTLTPEIQEAVQTGGIVVAALLGGQFLGMMVARTLRSWNFDASLRLSSAPPGPDADRGITPTLLVSLLVRLTVWGWAACWLGRQYGQTELAAKLGLILNRAWALATVLVAGLALGSLVARRAVDWLQGSSTVASGTSASQRSVTGAVGVVVYSVVMLLVLLVAADMFDWPLTRNSALALWQLAQHLMVASGALFIGCLGARWAREQVTPSTSASPEQRAGQYTALGIVAATTVLAVAVLLSSAGLLIGLAVLAVMGFLLWLVRGYLPDVLAGLQLRAHHVREVWFDGVAWQVAEVGFLTSQVARAGEFHRMQNRLVLEARVHGAPAEAEAESRG